MGSAEVADNMTGHCGGNSKLFFEPDRLLYMMYEPGRVLLSESSARGAAYNEDRSPTERDRRSRSIRSQTELCVERRSCVGAQFWHYTACGRGFCSA